MPALPSAHRLELLTPKEMALAEQHAMKGGVTGHALMENAGRAVAETIIKRWTKRPALVLCGPGNNGGDGFVVARHLQREGWAVRVVLVGERMSLLGEAAAMAALWQGDISPASSQALEEARLVIDALFGTGLSRPIAGLAAELIGKLPLLDVPVVAVDIPSGIHGETGKVLGTAVKTDLTVAFCRKKPGLLLYPGRGLCGEVIIADIGINDEAVAAAAPRLFENSERLWTLPQRKGDEHKYSAGHLVVASGGPWNTGAARLAATAGQRIGAGLVTVASPRAALDINAAHLTSIMLAEADDAPALARVLADRRRNAAVLGPALGVGEETRAKVRAALASGASVVLDADALTSFEDRAEELYTAVAESPKRSVVMTPHAGEFARLFKGLGEPTASKVALARQAALLTGAILVFKGADTVVAAPDGTAAINTSAPPGLATAGTGDVLAGMIGGFLAQRMEPFQAAAAAVFIHGEAAVASGMGLIAEDLPARIPQVLQRLAKQQNSIGMSRGPLL
jgi:ADP-dependent NAD(P)H-hydrate dehydratase / NAD(P)H-hydrate epimerase